MCGEKGRRARSGLLGVGTLMGIATLCLGHERGCTTAEILAIRDDGTLFHTPYVHRHFKQTSSLFKDAMILRDWQHFLQSYSIPSTSIECREGPIRMMTASDTAMSV